MRWPGPPGTATTATIGLIVLVLAAAAICARLRYPAAGAARRGIAVSIVVVLALSIPFAISGRWGLLGEGFNNDLGLHLAWAEWLRSGFGPAPDPGYPLGPHGLAVGVAALPGIGLAQAFIGEIFAIGVLTAMSALAALEELGALRRVIGATLVALPYLAASYFAQAAFKETAEALFVLAFTLFLRGVGPPPPGTGARLRFALPPLALLGGIFFSYSFAGLAWPIAIAALWSLTVPGVRRALAPRALLGLLRRGPVLGAIAVLIGLAAVLTVVGPSASPTASTRSPAATPTAPSHRSRRWGSGRYPTTASTRPAAPTSAALPRRSPAWC